MPRFTQGDIFDAIQDGRADLAIIFGHIGFNQMSYRWTEFAGGIEAVGSLASVRDPFSELPHRPQRVADRHWLWFVPARENHGMTDDEVQRALDSALLWATEQGLRSIATNGIANTDHGPDAARNRRSDDQRAALLAEYASRQEEALGLEIELVSLNDVFVRHVAQPLGGADG